MTSTFKNVIPKRKYRERAQPANRQKFGLLEKKKDYKQRAKNYHQKQQRLKNFQLKASLRNEDQFYFKMLKGKRNQDGQHIEQQSQDSDYDEKQFRAALKTQNYNIVKLQRASAKNKIQQLKGQLHMTTSNKMKNQHIFFVDNQQQLENFTIAQKFKTLPQLADNNILDVNPQDLNKDREMVDDTGTVKKRYQKLANYVEKEQKLSKIMMKIGYQKNLLGKQRKMIKKHGKIKYHKFFMERKK